MLRRERGNGEGDAEGDSMTPVLSLSSKEAETRVGGEVADSE